MRRFAIIILSAVTLVVLFVVLATYRVRPYESVLLDRFGTLVPPDQQTRICYGWYLCWPTDKVVRMDNRLHLYRSELKQISTGSLDPLSVQVFAAWRIDNAVLFYQRFSGSDERATSNIDGTVTGTTSSVLSHKPMDSLFGNAAEANHVRGEVKVQQFSKSPIELVEDEITDLVNKDAKLVGIKVEQVGLARMAFPPQVAYATYERMAQERKTQASRYQSEGTSQAETIKAEAMRKAKEIENSAIQEAQRIRGKADSDAIQLLSDAQANQEAREFYQFWRELEVLKNSIGRESYLILRSDQSITQQVLPKKEITPSK